MTLKLGHREFADDVTLVMTIVNRTPGWFYDRGATWAEDSAFDRVVRVIDQAAPDGAAPGRVRRRDG